MTVNAVYHEIFGGAIYMMMTPVALLLLASFVITTVKSWRV